ncbi:hypothetical protein PDIDSM_2703 [Penicillium digitatum]|nr:hypothetical protein PDIDSM_2703 [Penicillium digitatum]
MAINKAREDDSILQVYYQCCCLNPNNRILIVPADVRDTVILNYQCRDKGALTDFHIAHLGHLATKGVGLILIEATSVQPNGRISPNDSGLWRTGQIPSSSKVSAACTVAPWLASQAKQRGIKADESVGGWPSNVVGPSGGEEQIWAPGDQFWPLESLKRPRLKKLFGRLHEVQGLQHKQEWM